ncbi:MAG: peptide MFS transporter [Bacteroidota bacterium]|nr:peptide MFS transporter [Bacteroidota bacterium]MDP4213592.1 peptide MFS transporter [Bacteroidota bacterium]MDP4249666.1 peptide MFS transporter [Bacteroidota bacterium]
MTESRASQKHPRQLYLLFMTEMWERFSFYGMRALLLAYMVTELRLEEPKAYAILGSYAALVYTMPMFGGMMADRFLGYQKAIVFGGILMTIGHLILTIPMEWSFFYGMSFIICGNGFFKPNISSLVGTLYEKNDPRKDSGFSLFYMGINIGAALGGLLCGYVGEKINWHYGFGLAGVFMILGLIIFSTSRKSFLEKGLPPDRQALKKFIIPHIPLEYLLYATTLIALPILVSLLNAYRTMNYLMFILGALACGYLMMVAIRLDKPARLKLFAAMILIIFSILFWSFYQQCEGSLNLFALRNVNMRFLGYALPALAVNNFLPPFFVVVLSFAFARLWPFLNKRNIEPSTTMKFGFSFLFVGAAYFIFYLGCLQSVGTGLISLFIFILGYFVLICGELCLSPIGLSMVTKLSPAKITGMTMGIWFFATAVGEFMAGKIGSMMSVPKAIVNDPVKSLPYYSVILFQIASWSILIGALIMLFNRLLRRWMADVK